VDPDRLCRSGELLPPHASGFSYEYVSEKVRTGCLRTETDVYTLKSPRPTYGRLPEASASSQGESLMTEPAVVTVVRMGSRNVTRPALGRRGRLVGRVGGHDFGAVVRRRCEVTDAAALSHIDGKVALVAVTVPGRAEGSPVAAGTRAAVAAIACVALVAHRTPRAIYAGFDAVPATAPVVGVRARSHRRVTGITGSLGVAEITAVDRPPARGRAPPVTVTKRPPFAVRSRCRVAA
jgi:hypothetical protein